MKPKWHRLQRKVHYLRTREAEWPHCFSLPLIASHHLASPLQRKLQLSSKDEPHVGWIRSPEHCLQFEVPRTRFAAWSYRALVCFRMRTEWASKPNLLKFRWPGGLMILPFPLQRKLQLSSQDEQHVGWNRSHALSSSSRGFLLQKQILNFSEEGISQPEEQLRTSFKSSLRGFIQMAPYVLNNHLRFLIPSPHDLFVS